MTHLQTVVSGLSEVADGYFEMSFDWPQFVPKPLPGQFFTVRPSASTVPLLRRPFAFSGMDDDRALFIFERRGQGTELLAGKRAGDSLDVLGPLGNWFPDPSPDRRPILISGGIGVGPIFYFATELVNRGIEPIVLVGGRTSQKTPRSSLPDPVSVLVCTDDGSAGYCGTPIDYLREKLSGERDGSELYLCGPHGLLQAGHELAEEWGAPAWVSMEQTMGCAVGACMGCAVRVHGPERYARVCTEGPVFPSRKIVWT